MGDANTVSQAANRDYAKPTFMAMTASRVRTTSIGYAGSESDGLTQLDAHHTLSDAWTSAPDGHVVATTDVTPGPGEPITLALGFGRRASSAVATDNGIPSKSTVTRRLNSSRLKARALRNTKSTSSRSWFRWR